MLHSESSRSEKEATIFNLITIIVKVYWTKIFRLPKTCSKRNLIQLLRTPAPDRGSNAKVLNTFVGQDFGRHAALHQLVLPVLAHLLPELLGYLTTARLEHPRVVAHEHLRRGEAVIAPVLLPQLGHPRFLHRLGRAHVRLLNALRRQVADRGWDGMGSLFQIPFLFGLQGSRDQIVTHVLFIGDWTVVMVVAQHDKAVCARIDVHGVTLVLMVDAIGAYVDRLLAMTFALRTHRGLVDVRVRVNAAATLLHKDSDRGKVRCLHVPIATAHALGLEWRTVNSHRLVHRGTVLFIWL